LASDSSTAMAGDGAVAPADRRLRAVRALAEAAGSRGMVGGQAIDLASIGQGAEGATDRDGEALRDMHARKTGALIRAACTIGAILTGATAQATAAIDRYAAELGLAFQNDDDVLEVRGSAADLGKLVGQYEAVSMQTYTVLTGYER